MHKMKRLPYALLLLSAGVAHAEYQEAAGTSGTLVMEAENFHTNTAAGAHTWNQLCGAAIPAGALGDGAVQSLPADGTSFTVAPYTTNNPRLDFDVNFVGGDYFVWARGTSNSSNQNSVHVGLDGTVLLDAGIGFPSDGTYAWVKLPVLAPGTVAVTAGSHTVNLLIREAGVIVDKIVFTTDSGFDGSVVPGDTPNSGTPFVAAPPVFNPDAVADPNEGYQPAGTVTDITTCTTAAKVYYTTDGSVPTSASTDESVTPFTVPAAPPASTTVKAIASVDPATTHADSAVVTAVYSADNRPVITSTPVTSATEDSAYTYNITVTDADTEITTITASTKPGFLTLTDNGNNTATLSGTPSDSAVGDRTVTIVATDPVGGTDTQTYTLTTANVPDAPVLLSPIGPQSATQGTAFSLDVSANFDDVDPPSVDSQTFSQTGLPAGTGLTLSAAGAFSGTPTQADVDASPISVTVTITDSFSLTASDTFALTVSNVNDAPVVDTPIADQSSTEGTAITPLDVSGNFSDPDGDGLTFSASGLPAGTGLSLSAAGTLSGTPTQADVDASPISVTVTADDGNTGTVNDVFVMTVSNVNDAPVVDTAIPAQSGTQGTAFGPLDVSGNFSDPDGDTLTFSGSGLPAGTGLSVSSAGVISGTPTNADAQASPLTFSVTATDPSSASVSDSVTFTITNVNDAPTSTGIADQTSTEGTAFGPLDVSGSFSDPDGDALTFSGSGLPAGTGLSVSSAGVISGTPTNADALASPITVTVTATDASSATVASAFTMTVANLNDTPVLGTAIGPQSASQGVAFSLDVSGSFSDPDGDTLSFSASGLPTGTGLSISTAGVISGTPTAADTAASPINVTVTATDPSSATASDTFALTVSGVDTDGDGIVDDQEVALGLDPNATDSDGDGIDDGTEVGADPSNPVDTDSDGIIDALEDGALAGDAQVANGLVLDGGATVNIDVSADGQTLTNVSSAPATGGPSGVSFPFGMISYTTTSAVGGSVTVTMTFSSALPASMDLYKVDAAGTTYTMLDSTLWTRVSDTVLEVTLTDGDAATDLDGAANGSIDDPIAPGTAVTTSSGGGGGGGCAINTGAERDPTLPMLMLLSAGYLLRRRTSK